MLIIKYYKSSDREIWDNYVKNHPNGTLYHLPGWKNVIERTYGHRSYYLMAEKSHEDEIQQIVGILPLFHIKHFLFGNSLISIPFFDMAGILADDDKIEKALLTEVIQLGQRLGVDIIELRHTQPLSCLRKPTLPNLTEPTNPIKVATKSHKVRMLLPLPETSEILWGSFKSKQRNKIKKPLRADVKTLIGGEELLEDFYDVFSINMRDLGSPVHSKNLFKNVLREFPTKARVVMAYKNDKAVACGFFIGFKNVMENPWSSFLRGYSRLRPNYLLYWTMLQYASDYGFSFFDFGRSSPDEGTYKFKTQWGAKPEPLYWNYVKLSGKSINNVSTDKSRFDHLIYLWQKLPVNLTKVIGPLIRKYIGL